MDTMCHIGTTISSPECATVALTRRRMLWQAQSGMKNRLKELRERAKLTQVQLGELMKVAHSTIGRWENDRRTPNANQMRKLAQILGVHPGELYSRMPSDYLSVEQRLAIDLAAEMDPPELRDWLSVGRALAKKRRGKTAA